MIIIRDIEIKNYKNIKEEKLDGFKDFNILIGPNNCGKSNIFKAINLLSTLSIESGNFLCEDCDRIKQNYPSHNNIKIPFDKKTDSYLDKGKTEIIFAFNDNGINSLSPDILNELKPVYEKHKSTIPHYDYIDKLTLMLRSNNYLAGNHLSVYLNYTILDSLKKNVLLCPDERLQMYKQKTFEDHIITKDFTSRNYRNWVNNLAKLVDPKIIDNRTARLVRKYKERKFTTAINEQGSGVRSIVCLLADILDENDQKIILLDEPELGLNPFAKQCLLNFLLEISKHKQIFITTQDPTFINPIIWGNKNVSLYLYSSYTRKFVKPDIDQCKKDPDTSAGFLPHTVSLKNIHLYLEGASDVYIFQSFLSKFLKDKYEKSRRKSWIEMFNKVGMYHLCGDFWQHLLYTIPAYPYKCMIILDGDKKPVVPKILENHNDESINTSKLKFCKNLKDVGLTFHKEDKHPVYCLKEDCIEKYLYPTFDCAHPARNYNKKVNGPKKAEKAEKLPEEIEKIFDIIYK
jgi:AAA15 family ATPase/GTPase